MGNSLSLGIMQPYFFPYLGYFDLINRTDRWIVFDVVKYGPKSWMNRNRILHPKEGWQYVTVPVDKHSGEGLIRDVQLLNPVAAHARCRGQLEHYRAGRAPFYSAVVRLLDESFDGRAGDRLVDLNVSSLAVTCAYLGIGFSAVRLSEMALNLPEIRHPGQWALEIAALLGAGSYVNPPGGKEIFRQHEWDERGIRLAFTELVEFSYPTGSYRFVEHLSILDVLMWNSPETVKNYLDSRRSTTN